MSLKYLSSLSTVLSNVHQELGSLIPWSDENPDNGNVKGMVIKWELEAGKKESPGEVKRPKDSMSWTECKASKSTHFKYGSPCAYSNITT